MVCNHEGALLSLLIIFDDLYKLLADIRMPHKNLKVRVCVLKLSVLIAEGRLGILSILCAC